MAKFKRNTMTAYRTIPQLERCDRSMFGDLVLTCQTPVHGVLPKQVIQPIPYTMAVRRASVDSVSATKTSIMETEKRRASALVDELLIDIYYSVHNGSSDYNSTSGKSHRSSWAEFVNLQDKDIEEMVSILSCLRNYIERMGSVLVRQLKRRDALRRQQEAYCDVITKRLAKRVPQFDPAEDMRFTIQPLPGDTGFAQWAAAMKMVAQLPGGIPTEFRRRLWLTLAERHLVSNGVDWPEVERTCFSEWSHPADAELGVQIVKDLHRTGCSLFCGEDGQENQALLKRVLLAYARWNKAVGYCQGFNMLAALILQVTEKSEGDALKLMVYLIEGVLPDSYFADSLRGLSVDMAVFRELLRSRLPQLSKHLDLLQNKAKDGSRSYEPPLTNVFTMQWFLTLFCNCLPHPTVLRVWDLILLEGNEILLRTALAIWQVLADRILSVRSADEFYCVMGVLMRELLEFDLIDGNSLIKAMVAIGPLTELKTLREHYLYNINPWGPSLPQVVDKQLKLYSKQSIALDISALKKQYGKLKQRQRQAHIIFSAAISRQPAPAPPVTMNHLLIGKSALVPAKRLGPPKGSIPPARQAPSTLHWKDTPKQTSSSSSSDTELCDEESASSDEEDIETNKFDNLPLESDTDLMRNDNTCASIEVKDNPTSPSQNQPTEIPIISESSMISKSESDDENFEFEQFLADRVKCLKVTEDEQEERINYARRNSLRALQIIQENSMILHRILQCQSRLSPSPPPIHNRDAMGADNVSDVSGCFSSLSVSDETGIDMAFDGQELHRKIDTEDNGVDSKDLKSPEYGSRYSSILEKSKSLDEKYNALILKKPSVSKTTEELSSNIDKVISYSNQGKLESSSSTETLSSLASYDTTSNLVIKTDGNLPILVEEVSLPDSRCTFKNVDSENMFPYNEYGEEAMLSDYSQLGSPHKLVDTTGKTHSEPNSNGGVDGERQVTLSKSDDHLDSANKKPNCSEAFMLKNYDDILECSFHPDYSKTHDLTRPKEGNVDEDKDDYFPYNSNGSNPESWLSNLENNTEKSFPSTSRLTEDSDFEVSTSLSQINSTEFGSSSSNTASKIESFADFSNIKLSTLTKEDRSDFLPRDTENSKHFPLIDDLDFFNNIADPSPQISLNEFGNDISKENSELNKDASSPSWKNCMNTSQSVSDERNNYGDIEAEKVSTNYLHNFLPVSGKNICTSELENNGIHADRCNIDANVQERITPKTIFLSPDRSPARSTEHSRHPSLSENPASIKATTETDPYYLPSPSVREYPSRSTSPFISNDWYSTERNNKNLGLEVVAVGGSSNLRSPSRPKSLSPLASPSIATSKSPSKYFNPFPVPLGSRQTKEVPMKLGLYKK
ncbi:unnamed protein product [Phaedon cochleariae]|uniref:TBC1 domain family member 30 n=1 Tax=Phaedon cochleariae TaxID=80249 RepID=A0A9P0DR74_PHACE|nr:unnamed protein product [Phaedon cochleariae]